MLDLAQGHLHVQRLKNGRPSAHTARGTQRAPSPAAARAGSALPLPVHHRAADPDECRRVQEAAGGDRGGGRTPLPRPPAHAAPWLRLRARSWPARHKGEPGVARAPVIPTQRVRQDQVRQDAVIAGDSVDQIAALGAKQVVVPLRPGDISHMRLAAKKSLHFDGVSLCASAILASPTLAAASRASKTCRKSAATSSAFMPWVPVRLRARVTRAPWAARRTRLISSTLGSAGHALSHPGP